MTIEAGEAVRVWHAEDVLADLCIASKQIDLGAGEGIDVTRLGKGGQ